MRPTHGLTLVLALAFSTHLFSQTFGEITGVVTDPSGGLVAGASITVTNPATNQTRAAVTNRAGNFSFPSLLPATYNVKAEMQGFQTEIHNGIDLQVEQVARIDFQLRVGAITETIVVSSLAPQLNTEDATVGTVIENQRIVDLPLNGRNFLQLVALSPNVSATFANGGQATTVQGGDRSTQQLSISGNRREFNYFTLDGVDNTDVNFNSYIFLPSIDALQEFKVQTGVYSAEFGREAGQVNVSTKGGTNEYHGTLFEFLRNSDLDARPFGFTTQVPAHAPFKWNQYGFTLGGPVRIPKLFDGRNRLFFMSNFEGFRLHNQTQNVYSTPPVAMRTGDFSQLLPATKITDPFNNNAPFPNNKLPTSRLSPISLGLLEFFPPPNVPGSGLSNNYLALENNVTNKDQFNQRFDFVESSKSSWFGRFGWDDELNITPGLYLNGTIVSTHVEQYMIDNTRVFRPNLVNEARFGYNHFYNSLFRQLANIRDVDQELGIPLVSSYPPPSAWGIPTIGVLGYSSFGDDTGSPFTDYNHTFQWTDNVSWSRGSHSIKFGAEIRRDRFNQTGNHFARGQFSFQNQATGYGFADYLLGYPYQTQDAAGLAIVQFRATSMAYFVADTWKVRPNLTLDLGLRYEYTPPWADKGDSLINAYLPYDDMTANVQDPSHHPVLVRIGSGDFYQNTMIRFNPAIQVARDGRLGSRLVASDKTNWAPRLGIAWSPSPKWTVRVGAGIFYVQDVGDPRFDMARNLAGRLTVTADTVAHNLTWQNPFGLSAQNLCGVSSPLVCISQPYVLANVYKRSTPYIEQYEANIQRQIGTSAVLEVGYLGSQGHHLERWVYWNQPVLGAGNTTQRSPYPEYGLIATVAGVVDSNYNSLSAKLSRRLTSGLTYLVGYTFSKSIDDGSAIRTLGADPLFAQSSYCIRCERALSVFDARHRFVSSVLYDVPVGKGRRFLTRGIASAVLGGWQINSIVTASSGFPLNVYAGPDRSGTGVSDDRPNVTGAPLTLPHRSTAEWFNIQAFALEPAASYGNAGRNLVIGPGIFSWDFSTLKNFYFTEKQYLQFRFEAFNFLNHPNFGDPNTTLSNSRQDATGTPIPGSGAFGTINSTRIDMRELQFSLKLIF